MVILNELCKAMAVSDTKGGPLHEACLLPRNPEDLRPLPEPHAEASFDSSWEVMLAASESVPRR